MGEDTFEGMTALQKAKAEAERAAAKDLENFEIRDPAPVAEAEPPKDEVKETDLKIEEKMHDGAVAQVEPYRPYGGAMTWNGYDEYVSGIKQQDHAETTTYVFQTLMRNILQSADIDNKGEAIATLAEGFQDRLEAGPMEKALDEMDEESPGFWDGVKALLGIGDKAELSTAKRNDLPDSAFAYIEAGGKKDASGKTEPRSLRHYPIHDAAHVRNALARASQQMKSSGKSAEIAKKAMPSIRAAAKKMGIGEANKSIPSELSGFIVQKDLNGNHRWFGWVSNQFRDRDVAAFPRKGGEILSEEAHRWFVDWVWEKPKSRMPELWLWHTPGTKSEGGFDWIDYADGFLVGSGPLTEEEAKQFEVIAENYDLAMSHGLVKVPGYYDDQNGVANRYLSFEGSALPRKAAANLWTDYLVIEQEVKEMFSPEKREYLVSALGEDRVKELETATKDRATALKQAGVEYKGEDEPTEPTSTETQVEEPVPAGVKSAPELMLALAKELKLPELSAYLEAMNKELATLKGQNAQMAQVITGLQKSDDAKVAETLTPRVDAKSLDFVWAKAGSRSDDNVINEDDPADKELADKEPQGGDSHWIKSVLNGDREPAPVPR